MDFLYIKALHIVFVVTWFAGLFYIVRLFIYFAEAEKKENPSKEILQTQYKLMSKRLWYIITWPSAILCSIFAFWMLYENPYYLKESWMLVKLAFVFALFLYHAYCQKIYNQLQKNELKMTGFQLRLWNEVATIILIAVVFLVTLKNAINWIWGVAGIVLFSVLIMLMARAYKKIREKRSWDKEEAKVLKSIKQEENKPKE